MTKEKLEIIKKDIYAIIPILARYNRVHDDEIKAVLIDEFVDDDDYVIIAWPEIQDLMNREGFNKNCCLANSTQFIEEYGSSAYFVNKKWLNSLQ
jgi:hypothetical protein